MQVRAEYNDGKRALAHPAVCRFLGDMLEVRSQDGDRLAVWTLDGIRADDPDTVPLRLRHTAYPGERLTVREASAVALLRERLAPIFARHRSRARKRWLLGTVAVWLLLVLGWSGFPLAVNAVAGMIPHGWERTMGEETRATVGRLISGAYDGDVPWRDSGPGFDALQEMVERLAGPDAGAGYRFDVSILDADMVNAFALPGGFIVVTTGLIRRCRTPDELAGVLAHEMAHVTERHNTRRLVRDQFYAFALKLLTGGGDMAEIAGSAGNLIISSKFSREDEREADILGTRRLALAGVNPEAIAEFFAGFPADDAGKKRYGYLDSHPALQERQDYVRREADRFPGPFTPALGASKWRVLKAHAAKQGAGGETPRKSARGRQL